MPKLVFIGRKYHEKTKSDELILSLLRPHYEITMLRRDDLEDSQIVEVVNTLKPDAVIFWCLPPSFSFHLLKFKCKNIIWAPMWDGFKKLSLKKRITFRLFNVKILCFSKVLYEYFKTTSLKCAYWQCFLEPKLKKEYKEKGPYTLFLWQREEAINIERVVNMVGEENIHKIIYKCEIDAPRCKEYSFEVEKLSGWLEKDDYEKKLLEADFFIAPRKAEGIGFSFLEPMRYGLLVLAYNNATMNEYVEDNINGFLFDDQFRLKSQILPPKNLSESLKKKAENLYETWNQTKPDILTFIQK